MPPTAVEVQLQHQGHGLVTTGMPCLCHCTRLLELRAVWVRRQALHTCQEEAIWEPGRAERHLGECYPGGRLSVWPMAAVHHTPPLTQLVYSQLHVVGWSCSWRGMDPCFCWQDLTWLVATNEALSLYWTLLALT